MSRLVRDALLAMAVLLSIPAMAAAQATIAGLVTDDSGAVLPGVTVEASSPVLIEKVRTVVTDGTGRYRVVDLRPGTYTVSFSLAGFSMVRREGVALEGTFTATVDVQLKVGDLNETITVTGQSPIVDVQGVASQRSIDKQVIDTIPAGRNHIQYGVLIPGVTSATRDVGGTRTLALTSMAIHGGRATDQRVMVDGLVIRNIGSTGSLTNLFPDMSSTSEITVDYGATSAETMAGGVRINYIPQQGGNSLSGRFFGTFVNDKFQANNFSDELRASGLREPNSLKRSYDVNPSIGGAILRDKLWFYGAARFQENAFYLAGNYYNLNAGDPTQWLYAPDFSRRAEDWITQKAGNGRVTWQMGAKQRLSFHYEQQGRDIWSGVALIAPESTGNFMFPKNNFATVGWTAPLSDRLLLEIRGSHRAEEILVACPGQTPDRKGDFRPGEEPVFDNLVPVREQSLGNFLYRGKGDHNPDPIFHCNHQDIPHMLQAAGTVSYITGTHAFKAGIENFWGTQTQSNGDIASAMSFRFNNGIPNQITQRATPFANLRTSVPAELGAFVQDKWTVKRLTVTGGLRFDYFKTIFREMTLGPSPNVPQRNILIPESTWYDFTDLSPRLGAAYDLRGNGRTAAKVSLNRYVTAVNALDGNPVLNFAHVVNRSWTDADRDFVPDCDLLNPQINGECGTISDLRFGQPIPSTQVDPNTRSGFANRPYNWEFSTGVQHEVRDGLAVDVGYFRRIYGNFTATDNRATTPADFDRFCIPAPADSRLPNGGGYQVCDLYNLNPSKQGQVDNLITLSDSLGKRTEHWNGVDLTVSARMLNGLRIQGGVSTGRTSIDECDLRSKLDNPSVSSSTLIVPSTVLLPVSQCQIDTNFLTQVKGMGSYVIPKVDIQLAATLQSLPGPQILANYNASSLLVAQSLGRPLSGGAANVSVGLIDPGKTYGDRMNQVDLRMGKLLKFSTMRAQINFDLFNLLNANPVLALNNDYAVWRVPTQILEARLFKISAQLDF
jgi:hypothetical protein